jgi:hypothetical protein
VRQADRAGDTRIRSIFDIPTVESFGSEAIAYLIADAIPESIIALLTGGFGCGKTSLANRWGADLAAQNRPTLVLDRENPITAVRDRFRRLGITGGGLFIYWGRWLPEAAPQPNDPRVLAWIASSNPKPFIVVDSFAAFLQDDENSAEVCNSWFNTVARPAVDAGATLVVLHNDGKARTAKDFRGSSAIGGAVDLAYHVTNTSANPAYLDILQLRPYKMRVGKPEDGGVFHYADGQFIRQTGRDEKQAQSAADIGKLRELLGANPGCTKEQFEKLAIAAGLKRQQARAFLDDGVFMGTVRREVAGNRFGHYLVEAE